MESVFLDVVDSPQYIGSSHLFVGVGATAD